MSVEAKRPAADEELAVRRLDYERVLRQSRAAFERGDVREGLKLLDLAAVFERGVGSAPGSAGRTLLAWPDLALRRLS